MPGAVLLSWSKNRLRDSLPAAQITIKTALSCLRLRAVSYIHNRQRSPRWFGADKWVEQQNKTIAKAFNSAINKLESLYQEEAELQIQTVQKTQLLDYGELRSLRKEVETLTKDVEDYKSALRNFGEQLATPSIRKQLVEILDAMSGGTPVLISVGGGGDSPSDFLWDGRNPDEEEEDYRRRCVIKAFSVMQDHLNQQKRGRRRGR